MIETNQAPPQPELLGHKGDESFETEMLLHATLVRPPDILNTPPLDAQDVDFGSDLNVHLSLTEDSDIVVYLTPDRDRLLLFLNLSLNKSLRRPHLEEMLPDLKRVIASIAHQFTDNKCPHLHFDELCSQGMEKLSKMIYTGKLVSLPNTHDVHTRQAFFKYFKTAINNMIKGVVHKNRYTMKRTGHRPPSREKDAEGNLIIDPNAETHKLVEISLDDPEANLQVGNDELIYGGDNSDYTKTELYAHIMFYLNPIEKLVFDQMNKPNSLASAYADLENYRGRKISSVTNKENFRSTAMAAGLGITVELFEEVRETLKRKMPDIIKKSDDDAEITYNRAITLLETHFSVQIPSTLDRTLTKRLLTVAARVNNTKITAEIEEQLRLVGAVIPPQPHGNILPCFGVLYQRNHRICSACGIQASCRTESANAGLGDITLSPKLLGIKSTRIPALVPRSQFTELPDSNSNKDESMLSETVIEDSEAPEPIVVTSPRDGEIISYLKNHFRQTNYRTQLYFKHKEKRPSEKVKYIFWIGKTPAGSIQFRFCKPSDSLIEKLTTVKNGSYLPQDLPVDQAVALIDQHAKETFN